MIAIHRVSLWILLPLMVVCGCHGRKDATNYRTLGTVQESRDHCAWPVSPEAYVRDSAFVVATAKAWARAGYEFYGKFRSLSRFGEVSFQVDTIVYDSTGMKMLAVLLIGYDRVVVEELSNDFRACERLFDTHAMIGYREKVPGYWKLYDPDIYVGVQWCDSSRALEEIRRIHFEDMPSRQISRTVQGENGRAVGLVEPLGYGPLDCRFWTRCPLWVKGYRLPGYYSFEVNQNAGPLYPNSIKEMPKVVYDEELLSKFQ